MCWKISKKIIFDYIFGIDEIIRNALFINGYDKEYSDELISKVKDVQEIFELELKLEKLKSFTMCKILKSLLYNLLIAKNEAIFPNNNPVIEITNNKTDDFFIKFPPINIIISKADYEKIHFHRQRCSTNYTHRGADFPDHLRDDGG